MKRLSLIMLIISVLSISELFSQYLTPGQLEHILNLRSIDAVDNYLTNRGWDYMDSKSYGIFQAITWAYKPTLDYMSSSDETKAYAWLNVYSHDNKPGMLTYEFFSKQRYLQLKRTLSNYGYKFLKQEFSNDTTYYHYSSKNFLLDIAYNIEFDDNPFISRKYRITVTLTKKYGYFDFENGEKEFVDSSGYVTKFNLRNGKLHGKAAKLYPDGQTYITGNFKNGLKSGVFKQYDNFGNLILEVYYRADTPYYAKVYYPNGQVELETQASCNCFIKDILPKLSTGDWKKNGVCKTYYTNGKLKSIEHYVNGYLNGRVILYDSLGRLTVISDVKQEPYQYDSDFNKVGYYKLIEYLSDVDSNEKIVTEGYFNQYSQKNGTWKQYYVKNNDTNYIYIKNYKNDVYNGLVAYASADTIFYENYKNGQLNGKRTIYLKTWRNLIPDIDTSNAVIYRIAYYKNGLKDGPFAAYEPFTKRLYGTSYYKQGKKDGKTILYFPTFYDTTGYGNPAYRKVPDSLRILSVTYYRNGVPDGLNVMYAHIPVDCDECYKPLCKSCIVKADTFHYVIWQIINHYKNGLLDGEYKLLNEQGKPLVTGYYRNNKKTGTWKFYFLDNPDTLYKQITYSDTGIYAIRYLDGQKWLTMTFKNDTLRQIKTYFLKTGQLNQVYDLKFAPTKNTLRITHETYLKNTITTETIKMENYHPQDFITDTILNNLRQFYLKFWGYTLFGVEQNPIKNTYKDGLTVALDGPYTITKSGKIYTTGFYKDGKKHRTWRFYFYNQGLIKAVTYDNGQKISTKFYNLTDGKPLKGYYIEQIDLNQYKLYKIRKGKIHGKPIIYSKDKILRKLKRGKLKNIKSL